MQTRTDRLRQEHRERSAKELLVGSLGEDPWEKIEELREAGERKAEASGLFYQLDHERKIVLEKLKSEHARRLAGENISEAKLERLARADDRYRDHIRGAAAALDQKEEATSLYYALKSELDWLRTTVAHWNAMSKLQEPS